jgi:hypothetical protein
LLGHFFFVQVCAKMKRDSTSGSLPWGSSFCNVP